VLTDCWVYGEGLPRLYYGVFSYMSHNVPADTDNSNVPGVAMYFTGLTQLRTLMAKSPHFSVIQAPRNQNSHGSTLPKLSAQGNLLAGAVTRVGVGFVLNPFTVLKARYEVLHLFCPWSQSRRISDYHRSE
jgi:hypothetical protein